MDIKELSERIDRTLDSVLAEEGIQSDEKPPSTIFHYTTAQGLLGIIGTNSLWATHSNYLNDSSELKYGRSMASELLQQLFYPLSPGVSDKWAKFDNEVVSTSPENAMTYALLVDAYSAVTLFYQNDVYVTSFCLNDDLLSQWRAYGNRGGYSIGFDVPNKILKINGGELGSFRIIYDRIIQKRIFDKFIERILESFKQHHDVMKEEDWRNYHSGIFNGHREALISGLLKIGLRLKDPCFRDEQEWRIYTTVEPQNVEQLKFREQGGIIVPYVSFELKEEFIKMVSVRCGPTIHAELAEQSLKRYVRQKLPALTKIFTSSIPLRS